MKFLDVARMLKAGFTADEIRQMDKDDNPQENNPQIPQDTPQPDPEPTPEPTSDPVPAQEQDHRFDQLNDTIQKLIKTIQASNLRNDSIQSMTDTDINSQVDKIMAGIIRPEHEKKGD